ncbi:MAG: hypothetical protein K0U52_09060 [Gammaproteobacteria bacterium]|nr:hypothetical protein [Gammaproteobacteria bacterium]
MYDDVSYAYPAPQSRCNDSHGAVLAIMIVILVLLVATIIMAIVWGCSNSGSSNSGVRMQKGLVVNPMHKGNANAQKQVKQMQQKMKNHVKNQQKNGNGIQELKNGQEVEKMLRAKQPVIVMIYADWCGFCKKMHPVMQQVAKQFPKVKVCKINHQNCPDLCKKNGINGYPAMLTNFGERKYVGYRPMGAMMQIMQQANKQ